MSLESLRALNIRPGELEFSASRGSGPGGQNVNKVNSKVTLRWNPAASGLAEDVKRRFFNRYASRLTSHGEIVIQSDEFRDQTRNRERCIERLADMVRAVLKPPKKRRATKPKASAREKRLTGKKQRSNIKKLRGRPVE